MSIWERKMLVFGGVSDVDHGDRLESTFYNDVRGLPALFLPVYLPAA